MNRSEETRSTQGTFARLRRIGLLALTAVAAATILAAVGAGVELATTARRDVVLGGRPLSVDVADTPVRRYVGLALRGAPAEGRGMLFTYDDPRQVTFVRRGTSFPLDVVFVGKDRRVLGIGRLDAATAETVSPGTVLSVLELPAGWSERNGIAIGSLLDSAPTP